MLHYESVKGTERRTGMAKFLFQIKLLLWKRHRENTKTKWDILKIILPALMFFALMILIYTVFSFFPDGFIESFFVPFAFWMYVQRLVVQIMYEKSFRLQESMRMMGLSDTAYWLSYFLYDGVFLGFILSFLCTLMTIGGVVFHGANFGVVLGFLFLFCLAATAFSFFMTAFFDNPQTSSQATLALLVGFYVIYITIFTAEQYTISYHAAQVICCFVPPLALQMGSNVYVQGYDGISMSRICGILIADVFIYSILAWYFSQVWPSSVGVRKPFYFFTQPSYWFPQCFRAGEECRVNGELRVGVAQEDPEKGIELAGPVPTERVNEGILGAPKVVVNNLCKTFGSFRALNNLCFDMYENQIFALLGHNGAGKTTAISILSGLFAPDYSSDSSLSGAQIYGHDIHTEMEQIRYSLGVCPQHDILFETLTVSEHILFFAQLKGFSYEDAAEEVVRLMSFFHLENRLDHLGTELSGGQKRMLSIAIAICGGSRFIIFDEPTAGMDPLARRELWDLLASLRKGRTMLLTTHYMDEADVLGDRVGIMAHGKMQCVGSTQFLKNHYGAGYKLTIEKPASLTTPQLEDLSTFVTGRIPAARHMVEEADKQHESFNLPFESVSKFGKFFTELEVELAGLHVENYGLSITTLEDVFVKVGEDHTVTPQARDPNAGIGASTEYHFSFLTQVLGLVYRKLVYAMHDFVTIPLILVPVAAIVAAAVIHNLDVISKDSLISDLVIIGIYLGGYLGVPGLLAEFIVRERSDKLRNVLTVMGCDFRAYWVGTFIADFILLFIPSVVMWITWGAADMPDFYQRRAGLCFFLSLLFNAFLIAFSYICSVMFTSPKSCISFMPVLIILLLILPNIALLIGLQIAKAAGTEVSDAVQAGILLWGTMILSPHGAFFCVMLNVVHDYSSIIEQLPSLGACLAFMFGESALFFYGSYFIDVESVAKASRQTDATFDPVVLEGMDEDVVAERIRVDQEYNKSEMPLFVDHLRKFFPPKVAGRQRVVAVEDLALGVSRGEIFGLLGANGAGKTTALSMLTRLVIPSAGDATICNHSILTDFSKGSTHLGVVTQSNSLWARLSVEDHLYLFARLRGVPEALVKGIVEGTIDQLELSPHRKKLSMALSGGMKRKLSVAIALIGDPDVILLDEPSAGLDPVSRRNLWNVILRTMSHRAVILTTHSMEEAEALCGRMGIMVNGQIRVLGSKQRLKTRFGSGFELSVKLHILSDDLETRTLKLTEFVTALFPGSVILSENGGHVTYQVPREQMKMGKVFTELENHKAELHIEDYMVAQPTLEQVFIRTVHKFSPRSTTTALVTLDGEGGKPSSPGDEVFVPLNKCGCTDWFMKIFSAINCGLFLLFWIIAIAVLGRSNQVGGTVLILFGLVNFVAVVVGLTMLCCACCKPPRGVDE